MKEIQVIYKKASQLKPAEYNPRKISEIQSEQLKKSLTNFECIEPIIINTYEGREGVIIGGRQRFKIMKSMGIKDFPCIEVSLPLEQEKLFNFRLNKNTGDFDFFLLQNNFSFGDLLEWVFDLGDLNFPNPEVIEQKPPIVEESSILDDDTITCPNCEHRFIK